MPRLKKEIAVHLMTAGGTTSNWSTFDEPPHAPGLVPRPIYEGEPTIQQPPEVNPDPVQGLVAELSKRLDSIETNQRENIQALRQDIARIETNQRDDNAQLRQDMRQDKAEIHRRLDRLTRWIIGIQLTTLIALGTLILTRLPG